LVVGRKTVETRKFQIADDILYWLDSHFVPIRRTYIYDDVQYEVKVTNYAHR